MEKQRVGGDGDDYDAVVVGSGTLGIGGFVAACRVSMAGIKVCLITKVEDGKLRISQGTL